jgi:hypothetical protein
MAQPAQLQVKTQVLLEMAGVMKRREHPATQVVVMTTVTMAATTAMVRHAHLEPDLEK